MPGATRICGPRSLARRLLVRRPMRSRLFHAIVVAGSSLVGGGGVMVSIGCHQDPGSPPPVGADLRWWPQIGPPDLWQPRIDMAGADLAQPDLAHADLAPTDL